ncbi:MULTISPECIES: porin [unclassified Neptuniibacter]|uniref:porin n=1 Tax=unclassified Neptuniibacter TaxID=2630693 RepID=UPI000C53654D|nr:MULTISPECIES: porin [unclassified Neptuniibacter]MAY43583.1 porin [Oceanospirillaceae bacterium]
MKNNKAKLLAVAVAMGISAQASAAIELYNQDGTTFSADGHFNAFYVNTDDDTAGDQSRVRMGFLPNWIGFNVSKQIDDLKVGGRSSFWVTINDGTNSVTDTAIDVRQFYGTVDGDFGQVLFGKDFGLYARTNIFSDELLLGTGLPQINSGGVTFGNISVGYPYATPNAQITYRSPVNNGFQVAVGILDPDSGETAGAGEDARFEAEATYTTDFDGGMFKAWLGGASGESNTDGGSVEGLAYGARIAMAGFQFTASGFDQEGISSVLADRTTGSNVDSDGYLVQASYGANGHRVVLSHGETEVNGADAQEMQSIAYFYDVNSSLKLIAEYDQSETGSGNETDQIAIGAALSW